MSNLKKLILSNIPFLIVLATLVFAAYGNSIRGQFVNADDISSIVQDPAMQACGSSGKYLQTTYLIRCTVYTLFGFNPHIFHIVNISLHVLNAFLVFILGYVLFDKHKALIAALVFSVHPLASEPVLWLSGLPYLTDTLLALSVLILVLYGSKHNKLKYKLLGGLIFLCGIFLSKSAWLLSLPFYLTVLDYFVVKRAPKLVQYLRDIAVYIPWVVAASFFLVIVYPQYFSRVQGLAQDYNLDATVSTPILNRVPFIIYKIGELSIVPAYLTIYHEGEFVNTLTYNFMILFTVLFVALVLLLIKPKPIYAGLLIAIPLTSLASFSPVVIAWFVAERYLYIGVAFLSYLVAEVLANFPKQKNGIIIVLIILFGLRTFARSFNFLSSEDLWLSTAKITPWSIRTHNNLGDIFAGKQDYDNAIKMLTRATEISPTYSDAYHNLANSYARKGDFALARINYLKALEINPKLYQSQYELGVLDFTQENYAGAREKFIKALEINSDYAMAQNALKILDDNGF